MRFKTLLFNVGLLCTPLLVTGCGSDEAAPEAHGTPVDARLFVGGADASTSLALAAGQTVRAEVKFYDDAGAEIVGIDDEHFAALTFTPPSLVTVADVSGEHFQKDLTASADQGAGTYRIGYGHDALADETEFGPYDVLVAAPAFARGGDRR